MLSGLETQVTELKNPDFREGVDDAGIPLHWVWGGKGFEFQVDGDGARVEFVGGDVAASWAFRRSPSSV